MPKSVQIPNALKTCAKNMDEAINRMKTVQHLHHDCQFKNTPTHF